MPLWSSSAMVVAAAAAEAAVADGWNRETLIEEAPVPFVVALGSRPRGKGKDWGWRGER